MRSRRRFATGPRILTAVVATAVAGLAGPAAGALAGTTPAPATTPPTLAFNPPSVGPVCATIGDVIIGGQTITRGFNVCSSTTSLPAINVTLPMLPSQTPPS